MLSAEFLMKGALRLSGNGGVPPKPPLVTAKLPLVTAKSRPAPAKLRLVPAKLPLVPAKSPLVPLNGSIQSVFSPIRKNPLVPTKPSDE